MQRLALSIRAGKPPRGVAGETVLARRLLALERMLDPWTQVATRCSCAAGRERLVRGRFIDHRRGAPSDGCGLFCCSQLCMSAATTGARPETNPRAATGVCHATRRQADDLLLIGKGEFKINFARRRNAALGLDRGSTLAEVGQKGA